MIAIDTNVILHLLVSSQKEHPRAKAWLSGNKDRPAVTGTNIAEVLRLLTHPRVFPSPLLLNQAVDLVTEFVDQYEIVILDENEKWWKELKDLLKVNPALKGNEVFDARIALCLRYHGIRQICTLDADFAKYPFLRIVTI